MADRKVLHSWKEIAKYTGMGVRTVQRYETDFGLPVHRRAGSVRGEVSAFCDEVDSWLCKAPTRAELNAAVPPPKLTEGQIVAKRQYLAVAANAKRNRETAQATHESCVRQAKRVEDMIQKLQTRQAARVKLPA